MDSSTTDTDSTFVATGDTRASTTSDFQPPNLPSWNERVDDLAKKAFKHAPKHDRELYELGYREDDLTTWDIRMNIIEG